MAPLKAKKRSCLLSEKRKMFPLLAGDIFVLIKSSQKSHPIVTETHL